MHNVATITAVVGAVTGTIALIVSIKSYVRVSGMKALDLRIEVEKSFNNLEIVLSGIDSYLDFVHQSHLHVLAAIGLGRSGEQVLFDNTFASDKQRLRTLLASQPRRETSYQRYSTLDLENALTAIHNFHVQLADLRSKYQKIYDSDEERRKEIRAEHRP